MKVKKINDYHEYRIISQVIKDAFRVDPWHIEEMPDIEIIQRLHMYEPGKCSVYAAFEDPSPMAWTPLNETEIVAVSWFGVARKEAVPDIVRNHLQHFWGGRRHVYSGATAVCKKWQGMHVATKLKKYVFSQIDAEYPNNVVYTRMRSDNDRMININESYGFVRSGLVEKINDDGSREEWWFREGS